LQVWELVSGPGGIHHGRKDCTRPTLALDLFNQVSVGRQQLFDRSMELADIGAYPRQLGDALVVPSAVEEVEENQAQLQHLETLLLQGLDLALEAVDVLFRGGH
jgi:hypothetical protein